MATTTVNVNGVCPLQQVNTFSEIDVNTASIGFILVLIDETNNDERTLYFFDGVNINWVVTQTV